MLKGSDRRALRALGNGLKPVVYVGKGGITPSLLLALDAAHASEELVKVRVLDTCPLDRKAAAAALEEASDSLVVQVLGRTILLYRRDEDDPRISLPSHG